MRLRRDPHSLLVRKWFDVALQRGAGMAHFWTKKDTQAPSPERLVPQNGMQVPAVLVTDLFPDRFAKWQRQWKQSASCNNELLNSSFQQLYVAAVSSRKLNCITPNMVVVAAHQLMHLRCLGVDNLTIQSFLRLPYEAIVGTAQFLNNC